VAQQKTDQNAQTTTFAYDNMFRPTTVSLADGGQTTYTYPTSVRVQLQQKIDATNSTTLLTEVDGLGRPSRRAFANAEATPYDQVDTCRDSRGLVSFVSYAYQGTGLSAAKVCSGNGDSYAYDAMGRPTTVTHSDSTSSTTSYSGRAVKVQDEGNGSGTNVAHIYQADGLGRTLYACEVSSVTLFGQTGAPPSCGLDIAGNGYATSYQYDTLGNLTQVNQGALNPRTFTYDSLSRLTGAYIPEANSTTTYTYDSEGKLQTRVRPKPNQTNTGVTVTTTYGYDALHRVISVSYNDGATPTTSFSFDESTFSGKTLTYPVGRLTHATVGTNTATDILSYDKLGRVANDWQCTPYNCGTGSWQLAYLYNLGGLPTSATNGVGTTFTYAYNAAGRLSSLTSSLSDANHPAALLSSLHYNAFVAATQDALGNGVNETVGFDTRGRLTAISALKNSTTVYSLKGPAGSNTATQYAADDNVTGTIDSANGTWNYGYDPLNRISTAGGLSFDIDRNANRWHQNPTGAQISFDPATNRIASGNGVTYDAAGNITNDGMNGFTYDAEGRIVSADAASITYTYDAFGRRVRKVVTGAAKDYVYDQAGHVIAEVVGGVWQRAEIYVGGRHLGTYSGGAGGATYFSHTDWLGTERVRTNVSGVVSETCTSNPYGDALSCTGTDVSPVHYTGLERDTETNLEHAWFRYYNSRLGVWMTPDPAGLGAVSPGNPQSWNANAYVVNSPLNGGDPLGLVGPWGDVVGSGRRSILHPGYTWVDPMGLLGIIASNGNARYADGGCFNCTNAFLLLGGSSGGVDGKVPNEKDANNFTLGIRAPGQTWSQCMAANANTYSIGGATELTVNVATNTNKATSAKRPVS
jgi:RHS repeat-associated protein